MIAFSWLLVSVARAGYLLVPADRESATELAPSESFAEASASPKEVVDWFAEALRLRDARQLGTGEPIPGAVEQLAPTQKWFDIPPDGSACVEAWRAFHADLDAAYAANKQGRGKKVETAKETYFSSRGTTSGCVPVAEHDAGAGGGWYLQVVTPSRKVEIRAPGASQAKSRYFATRVEMWAWTPSGGGPTRVYVRAHPVEIGQFTLRRTTIEHWWREVVDGRIEAELVRSVVAEVPRVPAVAPPDIPVAASLAPASKPIAACPLAQLPSGVFGVGPAMAADSGRQAVAAMLGDNVGLVELDANGARFWPLAGKASGLTGLTAVEGGWHAVLVDNDKSWRVAVTGDGAVTPSTPLPKVDLVAVHEALVSDLGFRDTNVADGDDSIVVDRILPERIVLDAGDGSAVMVGLVSTRHARTGEQVFETWAARVTPEGKLAARGLGRADGAGIQGRAAASSRAGLVFRDTANKDYWFFTGDTNDPASGGASRLPVGARVDAIAAGRTGFLLAGSAGGHPAIWTGDGSGNVASWYTDPGSGRYVAAAPDGEAVIVVLRTEADAGFSVLRLDPSGTCP